MKYRQKLISLMVVLLLASCGQAFELSLDSRIEKVEGGLLSSLGDAPWKRMALAERMAHYNVPGVSIAVINDNQIEWAKGYGVLEAGINQGVTPETLFQTSSIAKPIVAVAALNYVEEGMLKLDSDVNQSLVSWQIPENEFTVDEKVTLRRLLSHSAGVTVHGFRGYAQGEAIPNLQQILDGEPPANSAPIRVDMVPGTQFRYSGGGYMIVQQLLEDVVGGPFPEIMKRAVLEPWGMTGSTFESPLPEDLWAIAASEHRAHGSVIAGKWHTYPEMGSGASMWATPSDIARFGINVMLAYGGRSDQVLTHDMSIQMLPPQGENRGLGFFVGEDGGDRLYFFHDGANDGYNSYLIVYPKRGQGVVIMTNGDQGDALGREILNSVSIAYGWIRDNTTLYVSITILILLTLCGFLFLRWRRSRR
ncbi:MAG: beta-lactamase family protein [Chloroflexi bacterium]|nr:beta-lactamase family protein [Chloroflexota bacterium]